MPLSLATLLPISERNRVSKTSAFPNRVGERERKRSSKELEHDGGCARALGEGTLSPVGRDGREAPVRARKWCSNVFPHRSRGCGSRPAQVERQAGSRPPRAP